MTNRLPAPDSGLSRQDERLKGCFLHFRKRSTMFAQTPSGTSCEVDGIEPSRSCCLDPCPHLSYVLGIWIHLWKGCRRVVSNNALVKGRNRTPDSRVSRNARVTTTYEADQWTHAMHTHCSALFTSQIASASLPSFFRLSRYSCTKRAAISRVRCPLAMSRRACSRAPPQVQSRQARIGGCHEL